MVDLSDRYEITSNRESGFGRYDVMLEPENPSDDAIILEFKVYLPAKEKDLDVRCAGRREGHSCLERLIIIKN